MTTWSSSRPSPSRGQCPTTVSRYTFKLREDVVFHNGEPFNADSVVFSWEVQKQPENAYFNYYERAAEVNKIDEYTVELVAQEPNALFLGLTGCHMVLRSSRLLRARSGWRASAKSRSAPVRSC